MNNNDDKKGFAKWLETLQQESWQLELIIYPEEGIKLRLNQKLDTLGINQTL